ncbi:MAG: hypothetical protein K2J01_04115 [Clostridiales bacterium]|nr:hypothetical protein [Clostridiales bacterium]
MKISEYLKQFKEDTEIEQRAYKRYDYKTPPYDLLKTYENVDAPQDELQAVADILENVVSRFLKAQVKVTDIIHGPQATRYELDVPTGVAIRSLEKHCVDIAYELAVDGNVRVEAPIQGKRAVAVELPNKNRATVGLRELVSAPLFARHKSPIPFAVGKNIVGEPIICDLEKNPHLLIAGNADGDNSVCLNSLIVSLLYKSSPEDVRFILINPEREAFAKFRGMPHLLFDKIVSKPIEAFNALDWADKEMNRRYNILEKYGCIKVSEYNSMPDVIDGKLSKIPQIVIIIDELAYLMQSLLSLGIERKISSLAALARAAGIHLIAATRNPSADVITGILKANFTSRIAFRTIQAINSRIIIDVDGAETLNGNGDMLYFPIEAFEPKRVQGAFVSDEEVLAVVDYVKQNYECDFYEQAEKYVSGGGDEDGIENDPMLPKVIAHVIKKEQISAGIIERRFALGYARVARIIDYMEEQGYIGPAKTKEQRRILITREEFKEIYGKDVDEV